MRENCENADSMQPRRPERRHHRRSPRHRQSNRGALPAGRRPSIILDCDIAAGESAANELTAADPAHAVTFHRIDLEQIGAIAVAAEQVKSLYGKVDILVNNAGVELDTNFQQVTAALWDKVIAINLRAPFLLTQALEPLFPAAGGAVINISSIHATHAFAGSTAYAC